MGGVEDKGRHTHVEYRQAEDRHESRLAHKTERSLDRQTDRQTDRQAEGNHGPISLLHHANLLGPSVLIAILVAVTLSSPFGSALAGTKDTQAVRLHDTSNG
ncbi:hypothetical protein M433DRAFT_10129 [Acidomyces richmondensis BFW]|nr:hypothetical protein M433DRAFT_10129 [Acidomyces richmondensis BFW]